MLDVLADVGMFGVRERTQRSLHGVKRERVLDSGFRRNDRR